MKIIDPYVEIMNMPDSDFILKHIEKAARTCYKSEDKITENSAEQLLKALVKSGHHSVFEHVSITVKIICDRGISHELVRHRLCSFSQESTRYANYSKDKFGKEITLIRPFFWDENSDKYQLWLSSMQEAEQTYLKLIDLNASAQEARSVLPNSLKTEVITTANLREWKHIFSLRCHKAAHPQMRQIMLPLLKAFYESFSIYYEDLYLKYKKEIMTSTHIKVL